MAKPESASTTRPSNSQELVPSGALLVKFRGKDSQFGVTRSTLRALAKKLGVSETQVIHMALSRFAATVLPAYAPDDGPLTTKQIAGLRKVAAKHLPQGEVTFRVDLFTSGATGSLP